MNIRFLSLALAIMIPLSISAQRFLEPSYSFSEKKVSYLTMMDGTELQCNLKKKNLRKD